MERIAVEDYQIVVLGEGQSESARSTDKGHLYERFIALLLREYGYDTPQERNLNPTSEGVELDILVSNSFTRRKAMVECKAYGTNVAAQALTSFYGKFKMEQEVDDALEGYLFIIPRLVQQGHEKSRAAEKRNPNFHYFDAQNVVEFLMDRRLIRPAHAVIPSDSVPSDPAVIVTKDGLYSCVKYLDPISRQPNLVAVWGSKTESVVPASVVSALGESKYGKGLRISRLEGDGDEVENKPRAQLEVNRPVVVTVRGSSEDFEYEFPASPEFFVGRRSTLAELSKVVEGGRGSLVLNAPSGSGKSSLALKFKQLVIDRGGFGIVIDSRTASSPLFVTEALRLAARKAEEANLITLPSDSSWASLQSATKTIERSSWSRRQPLLIFFDQFENVFQDEATTREFRDLTFMVNESETPILLGYAWKTDLLGWTESHPFDLRNQIREKSATITVSPMGVQDINTLLRRLRRRLGQDLIRELSQRLREYSQGLPWLFKKFAGHVIREIEERGTTQEQLVSEAINIQGLFQSDLAVLDLTEQDALRYVALNAPVSALEVTERYGEAVITSLLHSKRLLVAVDEKLDTYSDIFRDFLKFGRVSIEDSYTIGLNPQAVAPAVTAVMEAGGDMSIADLAAALGASVGSVVNTSRTLRLLGIGASEPNTVRISREILDAHDRESMIRRTVANAMKQHKAYSTLLRLVDQHLGDIPIPLFATELAQAYPALEKRSDRTWATYARAFALWFQYAGIAQIDGGFLRLSGEENVGKGSLITDLRAPAARVEMISGAPGPALQLLENSRKQIVKSDDLSRPQRRAENNLRILGLIQDRRDILLGAEGLTRESKSLRDFIFHGLRALPGGSRAIELLANDPNVDNLSLGQALVAEHNHRLKDSTLELNGKHFRGWARKAGIPVGRARAAEINADEDPREQDGLF